jgi:hypothetical protein
MRVVRLRFAILISALLGASAALLALAFGY